MRILQCKMQRIPYDVKNMERCNSCSYVFSVLRLINSTKLKLKYPYRDYVVRFERIISFLSRSFLILVVYDKTTD